MLKNLVINHWRDFLLVIRTTTALDAWLFPFMNVFAMLGRIDGKAPLDVILDGNGMLNQLGISCSGPVPNPLCAKLKDQTITLPIEAPFSGNTYGVWYCSCRRLE